MASAKSQRKQNTVQQQPPSTSASDASEFADSKVAVGAALTFIEDLQKSLPPQKYSQILDLLNKYYTHSLNERAVYQIFKDIVKGQPDEQTLLKGFERFLPDGALEGEMESVDVLVAGDEEEGKAFVSSGLEGRRVEEAGRVVDVTEEEDGKEKKSEDVTVG